MFDRFKNVVKGMVNQGAKKLETPEILAQEAQDALESNVKKLKDALTDSVAQEKLLEDQVRKLTEEATTWEKRATQALKNEDEKMAKD